jgi:hypothetical protein
MVMRMAASALLSLRKSLMTSEALSVTVSIQCPPYGMPSAASNFAITYS